VQPAWCCQDSKRLLELRLDRGNRCVHAINFGLQLEDGTLDPAVGLVDRGRISTGFSGPLVRLKHCPERLGSERFSGMLPVLGIGEHGLSSVLIGFGQSDIGFEYLDVLFSLREFRFELLNPRFVDRSVELKQRLPLLHMRAFLHPYGGHQRRLRQPANELDGVLNHLRVGGRGRGEAQADQEDQENVDGEYGGDDAPSGCEPNPPEPEKDQPDYGCKTWW
jgi:hypothetical protein